MRLGRTVLSSLFAIAKASALRQHSSVTTVLVQVRLSSADRGAGGSVENGAFLAMKHTFHTASPTISGLPDRTTETLETMKLWISSCACLKLAS